MLTCSLKVQCKLNKIIEHCSDGTAVEAVVMGTILVMGCTLYVSSLSRYK